MTRAHAAALIGTLMLAAVDAHAVTGGASAASAPSATATSKPAATRTAGARAGTTKATATGAGATQAPTTVAASPGTVKPPVEASAADGGDSTMTLHAGQDGTVFHSLTVEGEDRIHFDFERPPLVLSLDPAKAPGLDWGSARDVLDRTVPDLAAPLVATSAARTSACTAHPWLSHFASGPVVRFRPDLKDVERWTLTIVDAHGQPVASYQGRGEPPREMAWDGRNKSGAPVTPGLTYSYVLEAHDRAGNKRNFVGQGFQVAAYRLDVAGDPVLLFSGRELPAADPTRPAGESRDRAAPIVIEAATWLNQSPRTTAPVEIRATARTLDAAQALATLVSRQLTPQLLGDPARVRASAEVQPDAPDGGAVRIALGR